MTPGDQMLVSVYQGEGKMAVESRPVPEPGPGKVLIEVSHCGVCGSDLHMVVEGWGKPGYVGGHEFSGTVAALGDGVTGWAVGEQIVGGESPKCGHCRACREHKPSQCENRNSNAGDAHSDTGAFGQYLVVDARSLIRLPDGLAPRAAALAEPLAVALHGITRGGVVAEDSIMVIGAGPIGALTIAALVARGLGPITVIEPGEARAALAAELGATRVLHPNELALFPMWEPDRIADGAVDVVLECSGKKVAIEAGFNQLKRGGRLVMVGAGIEAPTFDPNRMILCEMTVCGSFIYDFDGFEQALLLLASGQMPLDLLIDPTDVPLDRIGEAMAGLAGGRIAGKAMVVPRLSTDPPPDPADPSPEVSL